MKQQLWDRKRRYNKLKSLYRHKDKIVGKEENYRDWETDRKSTRLNSSHSGESRMPSSA